jgi:hypothetical protein
MRRNGYQGHSQPPGHLNSPEHPHPSYAREQRYNPLSKNLLAHAQAHTHLLASQQQQMLGLQHRMHDLPMQLLHQSHAHAHSQGLSQAQAHAQQFLQQAAGLAYMRDAKLTTGQV